jgi:hypothetical protein
MNAASISEVLSAWAAVARSVGRGLPADIVKRGLAFLPDSPEWAISEDASALFALSKDDVVFSLGLLCSVSALAQTASGGYAVARCTPIAFSCVCRGASPSRSRQAD